MKIEQICPAAIVVGERKRALRDDAVEPLMRSIERIGIRVPIAVRFVDDVADGDGVISMGVPVLVAGHHRLEAAKRLGLATVPVVEFCDETDARLWEIAENLHRAELSPVERAEHVAEWIKLTEEKLQSRHGDANESRRQDGRGHRHEGGRRAAARELGVSEPAARRAEKIASLPQETRDQAREENWSQKKLLGATAPERPKQTPLPKNEFETEQDWRSSMMRLWNRAPEEWRERFIDYVQEPVFDRTRAGR